MWLHALRALSLVTPSFPATSCAVSLRPPARRWLQVRPQTMTLQTGTGTPPLAGRLESSSRLQRWHTGTASVDKSVARSSRAMGTCLPDMAGQGQSSGTVAEKRVCFCVSVGQSVGRLPAHAPCAKSQQVGKISQRPPARPTAIGPGA